MEAGKSRDLQGELASRRPRRASGLVLVQMQKPETADGVAPSKVLEGSRCRKRLCCSSSPKAGEKAHLPVQSLSGRKNSLLLSRGSAFLFY